MKDQFKIFIQTFFRLIIPAFILKIFTTVILRLTLVFLVPFFGSSSEFIVMEEVFAWVAGLTPLIFIFLVVFEDSFTILRRMLFFPYIGPKYKWIGLLAAIAVSFIFIYYIFSFVAEYLVFMLGMMLAGSPGYL